MEELRDVAIPYASSESIASTNFLEADLNEAARAADATRACCQPDCLNQGIVGS